MPTLTEAAIKAMTAPETGQRIIYDEHRDAPKGFGVRITANGARAFVLRYFHGGSERRLTIGAWPTWSLTAARKQATDHKREVDKGTDILEKRREERGEPTVADVWSDYWTAHAAKLKSGPAIRGAMDRHVLPEIGKRKIKAIRRRDLIGLIERIALDHARMAALVLVYLKAVFAFAEDREIIDANPVATLKPRKIAKAMTSKARGRVLTDAEIASFWAAAEVCGLHRLTALALKMILVTGQRPGEVAGMRWEEVDGNVWTIPAARRGKTDTAHAVPLTDAALAILAGAKAEALRLSGRRKGKAAGFIFEARPESAITTAALGRAVSRYAEALGNIKSEDWGHWTPHDLRRTMRTGLSACGIAETVAEIAIGHTRKGIAAVYDLHRYDTEKRTALVVWERRLLRIAAGQPADDNVVLMRRGAGR